MLDYGLVGVESMLVWTVVGWMGMVVVLVVVAAMLVVRLLLWRCGSLVLLWYGLG